MLQEPSRYSFVLVPSYQAMHEYVGAAQVFAPYQSGYLLSLTETGKEKPSIPHITICQIAFKDQKTADQKIPQLLALWEQLPKQPFFPQLTSLVLTPGDATYPGIWIDMNVERSLLIDLHNKLLKELKAMGVECKNASGEKYRPHLTLARIKPEGVQKMIFPTELFGASKASFSLALVRSDHNWQCVEILYGPSNTNIFKSR